MLRVMTIAKKNPSTKSSIGFVAYALDTVVQWLKL
jgi:hypothetical protein